MVGDRLKIRVNAAAEDGRANAMLLKWLAQTLDIPAAAIVLRLGEHARGKDVMVAGVTAAQVVERLRPC